MRRILLFISLLVSIVGFAQTPPVQSIGNTTNEVKARGFLSADTGYIYRNNFADTTAANTNTYLKYQAGAVIRTGDLLWMRNAARTRWLPFGSGNVVVDTTSSISLAGNGSVDYPLAATLVVSQQENNAVQSLADGIFVPTAVVNGITSGGIVTNVDGSYTYDVTAVFFAIGGVQYTNPEDQVTLANSDPSLDRIDVIVAQTNGAIGVVEGTPAADPQQPSYNASTQIPLAFILVTAGSTEPTVVQEWIYFNNAEWTTLASNARINPASTNNPYSATLDVEGTAVQNGDNIRYTDPTPPTDMTLYNVLTFKLRSKAVWPNTSRIDLRWYDGATPLGTTVSIANNSYGFQSSQTSSYQTISISLSDFGAVSNPTALLMTITTVGGQTIGFYIDDIQLQDAEIPTFGNFWALGGNSPSSISSFGTNNEQPIPFISNNVERMRLLANGNMLIGTTTDNSHKLRVNGTVWVDNTISVADAAIGAHSSIAVGMAINKSLSGILGLDIQNRNTSTGIAGITFSDGTAGLASLLYTRSSNLMTLTGGTGGLRLQGGFSGTTAIYSPGLALTIADFNGSNRISKFYGRLEGAKGADVASANSITLGNNGNTFTITGTTQLNAIFPDNWQAGSVINLLFSGAVLVKHNTAGDPGFARLLLAGSTDFTTDASTVLSLVYNGTQWEEMSRKLSGGAAITSITADNGLTANTSTNVRLGGSAIQGTSIVWDNYTFTNTWNTLSGSGLSLTSTSTAAASNNQKVINVSLSGANANSSQTTYGIYSSNTHTGTTPVNIAVYGTASGGSFNYGVRGDGTQVGVYGGSSGTFGVGLFGIGSGANGYALQTSASSTAVGGDISSEEGLPIMIRMNPAANSTVKEMISIRRSAASAGANGIGSSIGIYNYTSTSTISNVSNQIISKWTDATNATRTSQFIITGVNSASTADLLTLNGNGSIRFNDYGTGSNTGTAAYTLQVDASGNIIEGNLSSSTNIYNSDGSLTANRTVTNAGFSLTVNNNTATTSFAVNNTSTGIAIAGSASGASATGGAFSATANGGIGVSGTANNTNGIGVWGISNDGIAAQFNKNPSSTNTLVGVINIFRTTSGSVANGAGGSIDYYNEASDGSSQVAARIGSTWTDVTLGTRTGDLQFWTTNSATSAIKATLAGSGALRLHNYGVNTFAGVAAYVLGVDASGNVVEVAAAGAGMTNVLTTTGDIIYSSSGTTPARLGIGTSGQVLTVSGGGIPEWTTVVGTGSVTDVSWTGGIVSIATSTTTPAFTIAGTSGGIPYFSSSSAWASSAALADNAIVIGGGAGNAPETTTTGTGVLTALGVNVGSAGAFVVFDGALGTPSSGVATNLTGTATALNIGGNAATATILQTARTINGTSFDGSTNITVTAAAGTLTGTTLNSTVVTSSLTAVGTIATGVWQGTAIGDTYISSAATWNAKQTGDATLTALAGLTITNGSIIYGTGADAFAVLAAGTNGQVLGLAAGIPAWVSVGSGTVTSVATSQPAAGLTITGSPITTSGTFTFALANDLAAVEGLATTGIVRRTGSDTWSAGTAVGLTTEVTGTLPVGNGGTGLSSVTTSTILIGTGSNTWSQATPTATNGATVTMGSGTMVISTVFNPTVQTLTDGATITWNVTNGGNSKVTLAGTGRTLSISNPVAGYTYTIEITQGSGGSKTITTWPTGTTWSGSNTLSTTAGDVDVVVLYYNGSGYRAQLSTDYQ